MDDPYSSDVMDRWRDMLAIAYFLSQCDRTQRFSADQASVVDSLRKYTFTETGATMKKLDPQETDLLTVIAHLAEQVPRMYNVSETADGQVPNNPQIHVDDEKIKQLSKRRRKNPTKRTGVNVFNRRNHY